MRVAAAFVLILALSSPALPAKKKSLGYGKTIPMQVVEIPGAAENFAAAGRDCVGDAWAAAVVTLLRPYKIKFDVSHWVVKAFGGDKCVQSLPPVEKLMSYVEGVYILEGNRRVRITAAVQPGAPRSVDALIVSLRKGRPILFLWKGRPYLLYGLLYDENVKNTGQREFYIREFRLIDPLFAPGKAERTRIFLRDRDDAAAIDALITLHVEERSFGQLE